MNLDYHRRFALVTQSTPTDPTTRRVIEESNDFPFLLQLCRRFQRTKAVVLDLDKRLHYAFVDGKLLEAPF